MGWLTVIVLTPSVVLAVTLLLLDRGWSPDDIRNRWLRGLAWALVPVVWVIGMIGAPLFMVTAFIWYPPVWAFRQARKWRVVNRRDATVVYLGEGRRSLMAQAAPDLDHDEIVRKAVDEWLDARGLPYRATRS